MKTEIMLAKISCFTGDFLSDALSSYSLLVSEIGSFRCCWLAVCVYRSRIHYTDMYEMLKKMEPPVGFGKNCPYRLAYRVSEVY